MQSIVISGLQNAEMNMGRDSIQEEYIQRPKNAENLLVLIVMCSPMKFRLSVVFTTYNSAEKLSLSLPSLINYLTPDCELIVVDDGSTDNTLDILAKLLPNSSQVHLFSLAHNGSASVRNFALSEARGEFVMFCDSDDVLRLDKVLNNFPGENENIDFVVFAFAMIDFYGARKTISSFAKSGTTYLDLSDEGRTQLLDELGFWRILYRRSFLLENRIQFFSTLSELQSEYFTLDDYFFFIQVISFGSKIQINTEEVYLYFQNPQSSHEKYRIQSRYVGKAVMKMLKYRYPLDIGSLGRTWLSSSLRLQLISSFCSLSSKDAAKYVWSFVVAIWTCGVYGRVPARRLDFFCVSFVKLIYSFVRSRSILTKVKHFFGFRQDFAKLH